MAMRAVIEIAVGEYDVDMGKLMATALKKFHEDRDSNYMSKLNGGNCIRVDSGMFSNGACAPQPMIYGCIERWVQHEM